MKKFKFLKETVVELQDGSVVVFEAGDEAFLVDGKILFDSGPPLILGFLHVGTKWIVGEDVEWL